MLGRRPVSAGTARKLSAYPCDVSPQDGVAVAVQAGTAAHFPTKAASAGEVDVFLLPEAFVTSRVDATMSTLALPFHISARSFDV